MATTARTRRSRERATTGTATETTATGATATDPAPQTNGTPAATSGSEPTAPDGQSTPAIEAAATGPDPYVMIVAGQLSGKPDGTTGPDLVKLAGLAPGKTAVVLAAMEISGAAIRVPSEEPDGDERSPTVTTGGFWARPTCRRSTWPASPRTVCASADTPTGGRSP